MDPRDGSRQMKHAGRSPVLRSTGVGGAHVAGSQMNDGLGPDGEQQREEFVQLLTRHQIGLLRYITALVGNPDTATNILQDTNLRLWQKVDEFEPGTNFEAWATRFAYWQVRAFMRDRGRDRHVFSEELVSQLSEHSGAEAENLDATLSALRCCLASMRPSDRELVSMRHGRDCSIKDLSMRLGKSPSAIKGLLLRARRTLRRCIEFRLNGANST